MLFAVAFGKSTTSDDFDARFDLNEDGAVGFRDFLLFVDRVRQTCELVSDTVRPSLGFGRNFRDTTLVEGALRMSIPF